MKRALTQKVNPIPACEVDNYSMVEQIKPIPPEVNRRARTSAAMIGLAISMGASSLLMPQQGDGAMAAEPNANPLPTFPSAQAEAAPVPGVLEGQSITTPAASTVSEAAPTKPVVLEHKVQEWQPTGVGTGRAKQSVALAEISANESQTSNEAEAKTIATKEPQASSTVLKGINGSGHDIETNNSVAIPTESNGVAANQLGPSVATEASTALPDGELANNSNNVNDLLKAKQAVALNRLKESSNRLRSSLAEWKSEESFNTSAQGGEPAVPVVVSGELKSASVQAPAAGEAANWQPKVASIESAIVKATEARETNAVNQPTVATVAAAVYQVKPGDTINAIARNYGVSTTALAIVNSLQDPNRIQVSQVINIPQTEAINGQTSGLNRYESEPVSPSFAARHQSAASPEQKLPIVTALAPSAGANRISLPTVPPANWNPDPAVAVAAGLGTDAVPPEAKVARYEIPAEIAKTKQNAGASGKNNFPETTSPGEPSLFTPDNSGHNQGPQANSQQASSLYVERLRAEIIQLREQYRHQHGNDTLHRVTNLQRPYSIQNGTPGVIPQNSPDASSGSTSSVPVNSEYNPNRYNEALQSEIKRRSQASANNQAPIEIPVPEPNRTATRTSQSLVATAPMGPDAYQPYNQPSPQMVSPELPSLGNPDQYLPGGANQNFNGFTWPARGVFTSGYGWRWGRMHKGIDIAAPTGTPIFAAAPGVVVYARWNAGGYGNLVDIRHPDGSLTRYGHNSRIFVQEGQVVEQGQHISAMGSTGYSTGPHLHFEIHPSGRGAVNPMAFLPRR